MGKNKSVFGRQDAVGGERRFGTIRTSPQDFHDLLIKYPDHTVLIEISPLAGWVSDLCRTLQIKLKVVNTAGEKWSWKKVKNKSDRKDADKLLSLELQGEHSYVYMPSADVRQWRELISYRDDLVGRVTACKNRIRAIFDRQGERWPAGSAGWTAAAMEQLQSIARPLGDCDAKNLWRGMLYEELLSLSHAQKRLAAVSAKLDQMAESNKRVTRLKTVPGVGNRTAEVVVAMLDDARRFSNVKQVGAYTGMTPRLCQSGAMDRQLGISHAGSKLLRKMLVQASWAGQQTNPWMKETFERVAAGKANRKKKAIVAVARKLFIRLWAMDRDQKDWNGPAAVTPEWRIVKAKAAKAG